MRNREKSASWPLRAGQCRCCGNALGANEISQHLPFGPLSLNVREESRAVSVLGGTSLWIFRSHGAVALTRCCAPPTEKRVFTRPLVQNCHSTPSDVNDLFGAQSNGEDGWSRTFALSGIGSSLCSSRAVLSACRVSVPAAAAEISTRCPASGGRHYCSPDCPQSKSHQLTGPASPP